MRVLGDWPNSQLTRFRWLDIVLRLARMAVTNRKAEKVTPMGAMSLSQPKINEHRRGWGGYRNQQKVVM